MSVNFPYAGTVRIPPKEFQLRSRIEYNSKDFVNARQYEHVQTDTPYLTYNYSKKTIDGKTISQIPYNIMISQNTRSEVRDFRQSQPFVAGGADLAHNPYFDRYDPVTDSRNAVRELRSAVYEVKSGDGDESRQILHRQFENRWVRGEVIEEKKMDSYLPYEITNLK